MVWRTSTVLVGLLMVGLFGSTAVAVTIETSAVTFGGDLRVRGYALANMWDLDDGADGDRWSIFRNRTRLFARIDLPRDVRAFVRLANQNWGAGVTGVEVPDRWEADNKSAKVFVDEAWIELADAFGLPLDARIGRQTVVCGSGFVLFDGQSQLASTANYLDGARFTLAVARGLTAELFYFKDQENVRADVAGDDLTLTGLYLTHRPGGDASRELYTLRRDDQLIGKDVRLYGARLAGRLGGGLDYDFEGGLQRGELAPGVTHEAWGCSAEIGFTSPGAPAGARVFAGFVGLSGDNPATADTGERWDVFYGGWPRYGDLLAWVYLNLGPGNAMSGFDPAYGDASSVIGEVVYGNLIMPTIGLDLKPTARLSTRVSYAHLTAHQTVGADDIGNYYQFRAHYRYTDGVTLGFYAALLAPGAAYGPNADPAYEVFWETVLSF